MSSKPSEGKSEIPVSSKTSPSIFKKQFVTPSELLSLASSCRPDEGYWKRLWRKSAWDYSQLTHTSIPGFLDSEEAQFLTLMAGYLNPGSTIVELGTLCGLSTRYLAIGAYYSGSILYSIDQFTGELPGEKLDPNVIADISFHSSQDIVMWHLNRMFAGQTQHVVLWQSTTVGAADTWKKQAPDNKVDLLFVDADHTRCRQDVEAWLPLLADHALLVLHDFIPSANGFYGPDGPDNTALTLLTTPSPNPWVHTNKVIRTIGLTRDTGYWATLEERELEYEPPWPGSLRAKRSIYA